MAERFTAAQVLEQILSSVDQEDYSDCQEEEEEEVSEDEDGKEYNPERHEVDDASSPSSEEEQPEEEPPTLGRCKCTPARRSAEAPRRTRGCASSSI